MITLQAERRIQLEFIGITDRDLSLLKSKKAEFASVTNQLVDELYQQFVSQPERLELITKHSTIERLKETAADPLQSDGIEQGGFRHS
ncbi:protoglobin domain-containing protein [Paenibacillus profundus]|uniref:Protoglobin domain-containing protein n=1 Tax=Paenibacillus profundus TaxID=1173085 RepID=A0ABS8YAT6_9BACL|nr:protoglobin domain-containing protein [Paenibacillus profundus]MCE5169070.1 protoglobin domain-containing protein [Paenibacillus profundus]